MAATKLSRESKTDGQLAVPATRHIAAVTSAAILLLLGMSLRACAETPPHDECALDGTAAVEEGPAQGGAGDNAGLGWFDEALPEGLTRATARGVYHYLSSTQATLLMVYVPPGPFEYGCDDLQRWGPRICLPKQVRLIDRGFYLAQRPISREEYAQFCRSIRWRFPDVDLEQPHPTWPVANVSWYDAVAYCRWADLQLPTEEQWERAARGTDGRLYPWGDEPPDASRSLYGAGYKGFRTYLDSGVSRAPGASPVGALDMAGGVWEWCSDVYLRPEWKPHQVRTSMKVVRGGAWVSTSLEIRSSYRYPMHADASGPTVGFRPVLVPKFPEGRIEEDIHLSPSEPGASRRR